MEVCVVKAIVKRIRAVAHSVLNFHIPPLRVVVVFLVVFNIWQAIELSGLKKQVRLMSKPVETTVVPYDPKALEYHLEERKKQLDREQSEFDDKVRRSLERQRIIDPWDY